MIIIQSHRDLGGHLDSSLRGSGTTLTNRMNTSTNELNSITTKFGGAAQRATIVRGKYHARGFYSADTTPINQYVLDRSCTVITRFIIGTNKTPAIRNLRSVSLTMIAHQPTSSTTNDPIHVVFHARIRALRRAWHKQPSLHQFINELEAEYRKQSMPGLVMPDPGNGMSFFDTITPHPRTGMRALRDYTWIFRPNGPIGLLCQNAHMRATAFTEGWHLCSKRRIPVNILHTPTNHLTKALRHLHNTADFWVMPLSRRTFTGHPEMDIHTTLKFARANIPTITDEDRELTKQGDYTPEPLRSMLHLASTKTFMKNTQVKSSHAKQHIRRHLCCCPS